SVVVAAYTARSVAAYRVVQVHAHPAAGIHHLDPADVAAVVGDELGTEHLAAGAPFDPPHRIRQRLLLVGAAAVPAPRLGFGCRPPDQVPVRFARLVAGALRPRVTARRGGDEEHQHGYDTLGGTKRHGRRNGTGAKRHSIIGTLW